MKTLESILHMYLGCDVMTEDNRVGRLAGIDLCQKDNSITMLTIRYSDDIEDDWTVINDDGYFSRIKPILRPLDSMTEEEFRCVLGIGSDFISVKYIVDNESATLNYKWIDDAFGGPDGYAHGSISFYFKSRFKPETFYILTIQVIRPLRTHRFWTSFKCH